MNVVPISTLAPSPRRMRANVDLAVDRGSVWWPTVHIADASPASRRSTKSPTLIAPKMMSHAKSRRGTLLWKTAVVGAWRALLLLVGGGQALRAEDNEEAPPCDVDLRCRIPKRGRGGERRTSAIDSTARRDRGPASIKQVAMFRGERDGRVVQISGMKFSKKGKRYASNDTNGWIHGLIS